MQRIIQINIAGRIIPIEEDAYTVLKDYLTTLERQFTAEEGGEEIVEDIEHRIAELFTIRLQAGAPAIARADVQKVMDTLGPASQLNEGGTYTNSNYAPVIYKAREKQNDRSNQQQSGYKRDRLYRNPYDKLIGGVCSGLARYFDVDPVIIRLIFATAILGFGTGLIVYIIAWIIIPVAHSREELDGGEPMTFHDITYNVGEELKDLKRRGEEMSRELRDFFSKKK
jgi:phage shock protein C